MAADHFAWAIRVAWRWKAAWRRFEDEIDSAVANSLVIAARDYDAIRGGGRFEQWCYMRMSKEVARTINRLKRYEDFQASLIETAERLM